MDKENTINTIGRFVEDELKSLPDYFLVEVKMSPSRDVKVFIDADGNASIDRLAAINRALYKRIEASALFGEGGNFSLEVSSPGLDEPLKLHRQYRKNIHRRVEVQLNDGTKKEGELQEVSEDVLRLEQAVGSKKEKRTVFIEIPFNQIKFTKVCVVF
ncbi:MAG TPA: ribosome maturation factor [Chitinophagaceae bacterium]|jgi:ribosome maturation factor RimP|nr:ribosome maturation factor [Chitinophagaceae bacterium]